MSPKTAHLVNDILRLSRQDRAFIAEKLLESLDFEEPFELSSEWKDEIDRRCGEIDRGQARPVSAEDVLDEARARLQK